MMTNSRQRFAFIMVCGLLMLLSALVELLTDHQTDNIVVATGGFVLITLSGYRYLRPVPESSTEDVLVAIFFFLLLIGYLFLLLHRYGSIGLLSTHQSIADVLYATLLLAICLWLGFRAFSLRRQKRK